MVAGVGNLVVLFLLSAIISVYGGDEPNET